MAAPGTPAHVSAEPSEPPQWVKTSDDSVVKGSTFAAVSASSQYEAIVAGAGFNANDLRNYGAYTLRLVSSSEGNIEAYRSRLQQTANELNSQTGLVLTVAPGTVPGPPNPLDLTPEIGEIWIMISSISPCGTLSGGTLGCGGTYDALSIDGEFRWASGQVWLSPTLQTKCQQPVTSHEVGHALGLAHFNDQYLGQYQIMKSSTNCSFSALRAGDVNGIRWEVEGVVHPSNDNVAAADEVCPLRDTTMSAVTWFATREVGEPSHAGLLPLNSVWYRYTALQAGSTTIKTTNDGNDDFDTVLAVYTGTMFGGVVSVASNDDVNGSTTLSQVTFSAVIGTTYYIAVDIGGFSGGETDVMFDLPTNIPAPAGTPGVPVRFLDSRRPGGRTFDCNDQAFGRLTANTVYQMTAINRSFVTGAATSVVMNVTVVGPDTAGYLTVFPCGGTQPNASSLNFAAGDTIANLVIVGVGTGGGAGKICFFTSATTDLIVDVSNFFGATPPLTPLAPARLLDTRVGGTTTDGTHAGVGRIAAGATYELPVVSRGLVSPSPATVVLNVTAVNPSNGGFVTVYPCGAGQPNTSNLNFAAGDTIPNFVAAKVGTGGKVCFFASVATDLLVDVNGYFASASAPPSLAPLDAPIRLLDTRVGGQTVDTLHAGVGRLAAGATYQLPVLRNTIPGTATAVMLNVTAVNPSSGGYLTVFPCGSSQPNASNLNFQAGDVIPNSVLAKVGTGAGAGKVCIFSSAAVDLLVDASGYFI